MKLEQINSITADGDENLTESDQQRRGALHDAELIPTRTVAPLVDWRPRKHNANRTV